MKNKLFLTLFRNTYNLKNTIGELYANGVFLGYTLEDALRVVKIKHETAIPTGVYKVVLSHSNRFGRIMPEILNVPNFEGVRVHGGNTDKNTSGCPLLGKHKTEDSVYECSEVNEELIRIIGQHKETYICVVNYEN